MIKDPHILRWISAAELACFPISTLWFIWRLQFKAPWSWIVFLVWLGASFLVHGDTRKTLGWRVDNLWAATWPALVVFGVLAAGMIPLALLLHAPRHVPPVSARRFGAYCAFCFAQQVALNSFLQNRALSLIRREWAASLVTGALFASAHWPNPVLVPATFGVGALMAWLFARQRNIIPLAIGQAVLGSLAAWTFPAGWIHHLRVGPGYYG